jgi:hypothetical protein
MASLRIPGRRERRDRLRSHPLADHPLLPLVFDGAWYLARYPDVLGAGLDPLDHLLASGLTEGRDPSPYVDTSYLAIQMPSIGNDGHMLLAELLDCGLAAGVATSPYVDLAWYARSFGLAAADPLAAFRHLVTVGRAAQHDPSPFIDLAWYANRYPDIPLSGVDPFEYFVSVGAWLGRFPHPLWDEAAYIAGNEYVRFALGVGKYATGFEHFCATGHTEVARGAVALPVRIGETLDEYAEDRYLAANVDVAASVSIGELPNGVTHVFGDGHGDVVAGMRRLKLPTPIATATIEPGSAMPAGDRLLVLVHFDVDRVVDPHVLTAVDTYRSAGFDVCIVTVGLDEEALEPLLPRVTHVVRKSSNDDLRDFGGWCLAIDLLGEATLDRYEQVVLTNDSAYFPVRDPEPFLAAVRDSQADIFAATDSLSGGRYHLQSYFLALSPLALKVLRPELIRRVREQAGATKLSLIQRFEVGLSEFAIGQGLLTAAYCSIASIEDVARAMNPPDRRTISHLGVSVTNMTHHFWRHSLNAELPFLKVELLRDNPLGIEVDGWEDLVDGGACTAEQIRAHLERVAR